MNFEESSSGIIDAIAFLANCFACAYALAQLLPNEHAKAKRTKLVKRLTKFKTLSVFPLAQPIPLYQHLSLWQYHQIFLHVLTHFDIL